MADVRRESERLLYRREVFVPCAVAAMRTGKPTTVTVGKVSVTLPGSIDGWTKSLKGATKRFDQRNHVTYYGHPIGSVDDRTKQILEAFYAGAKAALDTFKDTDIAVVTLSKSKKN